MTEGLFATRGGGFRQKEVPTVTPPAETRGYVYCTGYGLDIPWKHCLALPRTYVVPTRTYVVHKALSV